MGGQRGRPLALLDAGSGRVDQAEAVPVRELVPPRLLDRILEEVEVPGGRQLQVGEADEFGEVDLGEERQRLTGAGVRGPLDLLRQVGVTAEPGLSGGGGDAGRGVETRGRAGQGEQLLLERR